MRIKKKIIDTAPILLFLFLVTIVWNTLVLLPCRGADKGPKGPVFSLDIKNKPLNHVLEHISRETGYEITVNEAWASTPLTATLNNVTVEDGLKKVIETLGRLSYLIITHKESKKIEILLISSQLTKIKNEVVLPHRKKISRKRPVRPPYRRKR